MAVKRMNSWWFKINGLGMKCKGHEINDRNQSSTSAPAFLITKYYSQTRFADFVGSLTKSRHPKKQQQGTEK
jgi:hypothetical protein